MSRPLSLAPSQLWVVTCRVQGPLQGLSLGQRQLLSLGSASGMGWA